MSRTMSHDQLRSLLRNPRNITLLDLRRKVDFDADDVMIPGAKWLNPDEIQTWSASLPKDQEIILYCAHGKTISNMAVDHLQAKGYRARFVEGGIDDWKTAGGAVVSKTRP